MNLEPHAQPGTMPGMRHGRYIVNLAAAVCAIAPKTANAQADPYLGPSVGVFFPTDSTLKDVMGSSWISFGARRQRAS